MNEEHVTVRSGERVTLSVPERLRVVDVGIPARSNVNVVQQGPPGPPGPPGIGLAGIQGQLDAPSELPREGSFIGEAWIVGPLGELWVWKG